MKTTLDIRAMAILVVLCVSWGFNQVAVKLSLVAIPPVLQMGGRSLIAGVLVCLWCWLGRRRLFAADGTLLPGLAAGLLFGVEFLLLYWGLSYTTAARGVVLLYLAPFVVALGAHLLLGERLTAAKLSGLACAFGGVVLALSDGFSSPSPSAVVGDLMCVGAAVLWGLTTILIKASPLAAAPAEKTLLYQLAVSAVLGLAVAALIGEKPVTEALPAALPAFLFQAVWVAGVSYLLWFALVRDYPASLLSSFTFLTPLSGVAFGALVLGEPLTPRLGAALVLVGLGIYVVNRPRRRPLAPAAM